jgi:hypothetical protein
MADKSVSQNFPINPDPQEKPVSRGGITSSTDQQFLPSSPPKSLLDWFVRVHLRVLALNQKKPEDTS